jgi:hypothetical protein
MPSPQRPDRRFPSWLHWIDKTIAIVAVLNLGLVLFDLSYIPGRDYYLRGDLFFQKFNVTNREKYLKNVDRLETLLQEQGLDSPEVPPLLEQLRQQSTRLLAEDLFRVTDSYGSLEEVKTRMSEQFGTDDAIDAFQSLWTVSYLRQNGWQESLRFFNSEIRFLIDFYEPKLFYDPVKGIEPYRDTQQYLRLVSELEAELKLYELESPEVPILLEQLREESRDMIRENYFAQAEKSGTLEEIKNQIRRHIYSRKPEEAPSGPAPIIWVLDFLAPEVFWANKSSTGAFEEFWSLENFREHGWQEELKFFNRKIRFLMQSNYYRHIGVNSDYIDRFWLIDFFFVALFFVDILFRSWLITRRHPNVTLESAVFWRWYDLLLLIPFWRWLRVVPVVIRLDESGLVDIEWLRAQLRLGVVASFAEELTQVVVVQIINQMKSSVESGELTKSLLQPNEQEYIDINDTNEVHEISRRLLQLGVCKVLPKVQPDLEQLIYHVLETSIKSTDFYRRLQGMGLAGWSEQIAKQVSVRVSKLLAEGPDSAYHAIADLPPDPIADELIEQLVENFGEALRVELQTENTLAELQALVSDLLEEIKLNYVKRAIETDPDRIFAETEQLRQLAGRNPNPPNPSR